MVKTRAICVSSRLNSRKGLPALHQQPAHFRLGQGTEFVDEADAGVELGVTRANRFSSPGIPINTRPMPPWSKMARTCSRLAILRRFASSMIKSRGVSRISRRRGLVLLVLGEVGVSSRGRTPRRGRHPHQRRL